MVQQVKSKAVRGQRVGTPEPMSYYEFTEAIRVLTGRWGYYNADKKGEAFYEVSWDSVRGLWVHYGTCEPLAGERWKRRSLLHRLHGRYVTHPIVAELMRISRPWDWHALLLEFPAYSVDMKRIAYFRNERDMQEDRRTVTSVAKYVQRHWGGLVPDHVIRDFGAKYSAQGFRIVNDIAEMVRLVRIGPHSCQRWGLGDDKPSSVDDEWDTHPYQAYAPEKGWALCVQEVEGRIKSRCLVYSGPAAHEGTKGYVRVYGNEPETAAWLESEGYVKWSGWPHGAEIRACAPWPYIDGSRDSVDMTAIEGGFVGLSTCGVCLDDTDGEEPFACTCAHCSQVTDEDDLYAIHDGDRVCDTCLSDHYTEALDRHGENYYPDDEVTYVNGTAYYTNDLEAGRIEGMLCDHRGEWQDAADCVWCEDADGYVLEQDATYCDGEWYLDPPDDEEPEEDDDDVEVD